jgi:hypothetical protein
MFPVIRAGVAHRNRRGEWNGEAVQSTVGCAVKGRGRPVLSEVPQFPCRVRLAAKAARTRRGRRARCTALRPFA